jgi:Kef-type K+ transport system membrane component KefB/mannitol/fructose-specific phosphotransferase system IIA component (Ntr-type)
MQKLGSAEIVQLLLAITLMLGFGRAFGELFRKIKQPAVVGEILAGIFLGPTIFGTIFPEIQQFIFPTVGLVTISLDAIVNLSIIFMLLVVGLEIDLAVVIKQGTAALTTGTLGMITPFIFGAAAAYFAPSIFGSQPDDLLVFSFFIGTALAISALPVIARTLMDLKLFKTKMGMTIMAAAMFNDLMGWIIFSIFLGLVGSSSHGGTVWETIGFTLLFTFIVLIFVRKLFDKSLPYIQSRLSWPGGILAFVMVSSLVGAILTELIGVHSIFGAFIIGVALGDSVHLSEKTKFIVHQFITNIFAPLFFVSIGLKVNFIQSFDPIIVLVIIVLGFLGKIIGCGFGAKISGFNNNESLSIGFAMNSRGVLEIVLSLVAIQSGIISEEIFVAIIILVLSSSVLAGPLMSYFTKDSRKYSFMDLIDSKSIIVSDYEKKEDQIKQLCKVASDRYKLNYDEISSRVIQRENLIPTGIGNFVAIPHAKVKINKPIVTIGINKKGLDFEAPDHQLSKIIILLLTPEDKNELQLQLLADVANKFRDKEKIASLLNISSEEEFMSKIKEELA